MPMAKNAVRWMLACSLMAVTGVAAAPLAARATPLKVPEPIVTSPSHARAPAKSAMRRVLRLKSAARACLDHRRLRMGVASWYGGAALHRTASGEAFRGDVFAAASRTLPFNTRVRVTNLYNGRSVVVRINDRGPFVRGRIIDVTPKAAAALGMKAHGTAPVYLEIVSRETQAAEAAGFDRR